MEASKTGGCIWGHHMHFMKEKGDGFDDLINTYKFVFSETQSLDPNVCMKR